MKPQQGDLLSWTPPASDRFGDTYDHAFDFERLNAQQGRVFLVMRDGKWRTLREISDLTGDPEASVSARLRDLRRPEFGNLDVQRQRMGEGRGTYVYRIDPKTIPGAH